LRPELFNAKSSISEAIEHIRNGPLLPQRKIMTDQLVFNFPEETKEEKEAVARVLYRGIQPPEPWPQPGESELKRAMSIIRAEFAKQHEEEAGKFFYWWDVGFPPRIRDRKICREAVCYLMEVIEREIL
jgi:hypothetical protein